MSYSQYKEEEYILRSLKQKSGKFLDIGAWHPTVFSNTRALFERGWSGVLIEPSPGPFLNLMRACSKCGDVPAEIYGERNRPICVKCGHGVRYATDPKLTLICAAVGLNSGLMEINATDDAVSTSDPANLEKWQKDGGFYGKILVPVLTINDIFNRFGSFDFINFDAEGISTSLLINMIQNSGARPQCICVEHDDRIVEISQVAHEVGYITVYNNGTNLVLKYGE